ncbi:1-acyl-sn-glycerol-3-phosphate acyltransferase [Sediminibacterium goheungense]|uniref:1-acyl-sn-glycerol-3-phosphate acyltransferase n=1 Tax=Sediminibacterium goheungense TaxID=1086393 RepID=A0A4R6J2C3_9BACT|nr:1-acyl-sn-glycerol-3-phosphate acyltransferase [Sediminibacterium goheungense]
MIYALLKLPIRLALSIFCVDFQTVHSRFFREKGPILLIANHPNSFLDAIIIAAQFRDPVYFLARGDAFHKPWHRFLLNLLHMVPIYRLSEGRENLHLNEYAFTKSLELLAEGKIVLIFIEGICLNTHELQPFKKGAARISIMAKQQKIPVQVMLAAISYNSFKQIGKEVRLELSEPLPINQQLPYEQDVQNIRNFNELIFNQLKSMIQLPPKAEHRKKDIFLLLSIIGYFLHLPLYSIIQKWVFQKTRKTVFYDSVLFAALLFIYPLYLLLLLLFLFIIHVPLLLIALIILIHPITAWVAVRYKIKPETSL